MPHQIMNSRSRACRACGCTELRACPGGCWWVLLDVHSPSGICSTCAEQIEWHPALLRAIGFDDPVSQAIIHAFQMSELRRA